MFFDFDNTCRKLKNLDNNEPCEVWNTNNNYYNNQKLVLDHYLKYYINTIERTEIQKIFLINGLIFIKKMFIYMLRNLVKIIY